MALESCKVIILSRGEYLAVRIDDKKSDGVLFRKILSGTISLKETIEREVNLSFLYPYVDLMPINLVKFDTETEN